MSEKALVCTSCTAHYHNGDASYLDMWFDDTEQEARDEYLFRLECNINALAEPTGETGVPDGYWECWVCSDTFMAGTAHEFRPSHA